MGIGSKDSWSRPTVLSRVGKADAVRPYTSGKLRLDANKSGSSTQTQRVANNL